MMEYDRLKQDYLTQSSILLVQIILKISVNYFKDLNYLEWFFFSQPMLIHNIEK